MGLFLVLSLIVLNCYHLQLPRLIIDSGAGAVNTQGTSEEAFITIIILS